MAGAPACARRVLWHPASSRLLAAALAEAWQQGGGSTADAPTLHWLRCFCLEVTAEMLDYKVVAQLARDSEEHLETFTGGPLLLQSRAAPSACSCTCGPAAPAPLGRWPATATLRRRSDGALL